MSQPKVIRLSGQGSRKWMQQHAEQSLLEDFPDGQPRAADPSQALAALDAASSGEGVLLQQQAQELTHHIQRPLSSHQPYWFLRTQRVSHGSMLPDMMAALLTG